MFVPGETIAFLFNLPFNKEIVDTIQVSFRQSDRIILVVTVNQGSLIHTEKGSQFTVGLSQQQSLLFDDNACFYAQLNVLFTTGTRATSKEMRGENILQHIRKVVS